jgi:hypothetical protein
MDWFTPTWMWLALGGPPAPSSWSRDEAGSTARANVGPHPTPSALDLALIQLTYKVVAASTTCNRCGAPLGRGLRVVPSAADLRSWTVSIVTRCGGWRRHRHLALVEEASRDLVLGPFQPG